MIASGLAPRAAVALGAARSPDLATTALAERLFAGPRFSCLDPF
jgi:hypothetical protein